MSSEARGTSSRLSDALDKIFSGITGDDSDAAADESTTDRPARAEPDADRRDPNAPGADPLLSAPRTPSEAREGRSEPAERAAAPQTEARDTPVEPSEPPASVPTEAPADEPYDLPTIVPATEHPSLPDGPRVLPRTPTESGNRTGPVAPAVGVPAPSSPSPTGPTVHATGPAVGRLRAPGRRPRVRRVTRVVRHIDPWSTFKVALIFNVVAYVVCLTSGVLLWRVADSTGTLDNVERWFTQFGWETFELRGGEIFDNAWIIGLFGVVAATGGAVLLVTLFNLVSDIVGGVRLTVLEEEVVERTVSSTRRYVVRRPTDADAPSGPPVPDWSADDLDDGSPSEPTQPIADGDRPSRDRPAASEPPPTADWSVD